MTLPPHRPVFEYMAYDDPRPVLQNGFLWDMALPQSRHADQGSTAAATKNALTYGAYFEAVSGFFDSERLAIIAKIVSRRRHRTIFPGEISRIQIRLEKHGAFYHPARIVLFWGSDRITLMLNVAVSALGIQHMGVEYRTLSRLAKRYSPAWVPNVFVKGQVRVTTDRYVEVFVGEWFEDFHEFHVSFPRAASGATGVRVWDPGNKALFLTPQETQSLLEQAAMILTAYYNVITSEQIDAWHHAAGDFVVSRHTDDLQVKLITVRRYAPLLDMAGEAGRPEATLNALLIFLLNISVSLRIDRLDGIGDLTWIDGDVAVGIIRGFFRGLALQAHNGHITDSLVAATRKFILRLPETDIRDFFAAIVRRRHPQNPDLPVITQHLANHVEAVLSGLAVLRAEG